MRDVVSLILMLLGAFFMFVAAVGIVRMPDLFLRMSPTSKSATLGAACMLLAAAVHFNAFGITWPGTVRDDLRGKYDETLHRLVDR